MEQKNTSMVVGFIGLGAMGSGMAAALLQKGFIVKGYDVSMRNLNLFFVC